MYGVNPEEYDIDTIRNELGEELYGAGMMTGFDAAFGDWSSVEKLSDEEVIAKALNMGYDLSEFRKDKYVK